VNKLIATFTESDDGAAFASHYGSAVTHIRAVHSIADHQHHTGGGAVFHAVP
jgi:hypothetical protein